MSKSLHRVRNTGNPPVKVNQRNYQSLRDGFTAEERRGYDELMRRHGRDTCSSCRQGRVNSCQWDLEAVEQVVIARREVQLRGDWRLHQIDYRKMGMYPRG